MKSNGRKFTKNDAAFTGLEAAIVLIAFVVVAAVFSYVMLGAGFFTSQKAKETVNTGVAQATSSVEVTQIVGYGDTTTGKLTGVSLTVELTAGNNPVDINNTIIAYQTNNTYNSSVFCGSDWASSVKWVNQVNANNLLEQFERVQLNINFTSDEQVGVNTPLTLTIEPPTGATYPVTVTTPPAMASIMSLV